MTTVTFETAALADSINKAASIAPNTGQAFDKAAGILIEVDPEREVAVIKSTDTVVYYMEWVTPTECSGDPVVWRVPSKLVSGVIGSLPIGSGKTVTLHQVDRTLHITSGRTKCRFQLIDREYYPDWAAFDPSSDALSSVSGFGARFKQVAWAASTNNDPPITSVYLDGERMAATDRYRAAAVPMALDLPHPVSVPPSGLATILKSEGEVKIGLIGPSKLGLMPDDHTQIIAIIDGFEYPTNINRIITLRDYPEMVETSRNAIVECINRSRHVIGADRTPLLKAWFGREEIAFAVLQETALLGDVVETPGYAIHEKRYEMGFGHQNLLGALTNAPNDKIKLSYNPSKPKDPLYIDGGSGYEAWVAPRKEMPGGSP